ncbi:hypothetical protein ABZ934_26945 [Streptomyces sp. NPDC046557]|uniref:hypothetical protein n=1 Tax=Streptomyces sp. NPDC046557 TaxID=3155372 RepID=UPI0033E1A331
MFTSEAVGGLIGSLLTRRIVAAFGQGRATCALMVVSALLWLLALPFYRADWRFAVAVVCQGLGWTAFITFKVSSVAYRQRLCPEPLLCRMTATFRFVVWGSMPVRAPRRAAGRAVRGPDRPVGRGAGRTPRRDSPPPLAAAHGR